MSLDIFFEQFVQLADAPNGVQKLRELILQLAVQGKLVPQDPTDEPASVLLDTIRAERDRLVQAKKIRHSKPLPDIELSEIPFELPSGWTWIRLHEIGDWGAGATPDRKRVDYYGGSIRWLKSGELNDGYVSESEEKITEQALRDCSLRLDQPGDVLIAMYGATIGKLAILETEATTNQAVCACTCFSGMYNRYLFYLLKAYRPRFLGQGAGGAQPNISREKIIHTVAPLPPLAEQRRIVAKVDQLMALCDELESRKQQQRAARVKLNDVSLDSLLAAQNSDDIAAHWQRIHANFDLLYDTPETIGKLRQAILQLAVQGKLVPQDPNDEPASVLLDTIRTEKARSKGQFQLLEEDVEIDQIPFELPRNWRWTVTEVVAEVVDPHPSHRTPPHVDRGVPYIGMGDINDDLSINFHKARKVAQAVFDEHKERYQLKPGDYIFGKIGTVGQPVKLMEPFDYTLSANVVLIQPNLASVLPAYLFHYMSSPILEQMLKTSSRITTHAAFGIKRIRKLPVPLPPLAEQRRIVAKVDHLMALCDELEAKLKNVQTVGERLVEAVVRGVLAENRLEAAMQEEQSWL